MKKIIIGVTGASGSILADHIINTLLQQGHAVHFIATTLGAQVMSYELESSFEKLLQTYKTHLNFYHHENNDLFASVASGSFPIDAMCIIPCSMGTLGKIASGISDNLVCRAADVTIKERRHLVLVVRETPLSSIHLENMLKLSRNGAIIMPPVPAFYNKPQSIEDVAKQTVARVLQTLNIKSDDLKIWTEDKNDA